MTRENVEMILNNKATRFVAVEYSIRIPNHTQNSSIFFLRSRAPLFTRFDSFEYECAPLERQRGMPTCQTMIANNSIAAAIPRPHRHSQSRSRCGGAARRLFALKRDTRALRANLFIRPKHLNCLDDFVPPTFGLLRLLPLPRSASTVSQYFSAVSLIQYLESSPNEERIIDGIF